MIWKKKALLKIKNLMKYKYIYEINREEKNDSLKDENNKDLNIDKNI